MAINWETTPHYVMKFTADSQVEIFDPAGQSMPAYAKATQLLINITEGQIPIVVSKGPIE